MPQQDLVILFPIWACMALVTLVLTQASQGPGYSIPHKSFTLTRDLWSHSGPQTKWLLWFPLWASPLPGDSGHPLGFTWALCLVLSWSAPGSGDWSPPGLHLDLVNPVATCTSPGPCDCGPTWTSPGPGGSGSHMGLSWTWFLWSQSGLTWNTMTVIHFWSFPGPVDTGPYLGIIGTWILS